jgi:hypothetical protein
MANENVLEPVSNAQEAEMAKVAQYKHGGVLDHSRDEIVLVEEGRAIHKERPPLNRSSQALLRVIADLLASWHSNKSALVPHKHEMSTPGGRWFF